MPVPEPFLSLINFGALGIILVLFLRGDLVPKSVYEREIKRGDAATETAAKTSEALKVMTDAIKALGEQLRGQPK